MTSKPTWAERAEFFTDLSLVLTAAMDETRRLGHREVDTDHLLLGLIASGGASSQLLATRGVTLARAREALVEVQRSDLAAVGIDMPDTSLSPPPHYAHGEDLDLTARAVEVAYCIPHHGTDLSVLRALSSDPLGPAARVLDHLGVHLDDLDLITEAPPADDPASAEDGMWHATYTTDTDIPLDQIWALLDDPRQRPRWDGDIDTVEVTDDGFVGHRLHPDGWVDRLVGRALQPAHGYLEERTPPTAIQWRTVYGGRLGTTQRLRIELEPHGTGARITLRHRTENGRGLTRARRATGRARLRLYAQALVQAATP